MACLGGYFLANQVSVVGSFWSFFGANTFGITLVPMLFGVGLLFWNGRSTACRILILAGSLFILAGVLANMHIYGVVGIYGVIAYSVSQRTREIGIRMALGAQQQTLTGMFVRQGLKLTGIGVACGLFVAIIVMRLMSALLFKVSPMDPVAYAAASLGLVATAFLASYLPSRRASTVDPVEALRAE
jgi:ABC-type antimicrobial peptide transport system permease subunit